MVLCLPPPPRQPHSDPMQHQHVRCLTHLCCVEFWEAGERFAGGLSFKPPSLVGVASGKGAPMTELLGVAEGQSGLRHRAALRCNAAKLPEPKT